MAALPTAISANLGSSYGGVFIAAFIATGLWGASSIQSFNYFFNYPGDSWILKSMVAWLWIMDTTHQVALNAGLYKVLISKFGSIEAVTVLRPEFTLQILFTVLGSTVAQLFFTYRLWMFSEKKWIIPAVLVPSVVAQFAVQTVYMTRLLINPTLDQIRASGTLAIAFDAMAAATDVGIAFAMVYLLLQENTQFKQSHRMVSYLVMMTVNSGLWTAIVALGVVITLVVIPSPSLTFGAIYSCLSPIYCNTVLANLNSRNYLRQSARNASTHSQISHPMDTFARDQLDLRSQKQSPNAISIQVDTARVTDEDSLQGNDLKREFSV
jgi:hypothetical protein